MPGRAEGGVQGRGIHEPNVGHAPVAHKADTTLYPRYMRAVEQGMPS